MKVICKRKLSKEKTKDKSNMITVSYSAVLTILIKIVMLFTTIVTYKMTKSEHINNEKELFSKCKTVMTMSKDCKLNLTAIHLKYKSLEEQLGSIDVEILNRHEKLVGDIDKFTADIRERVSKYRSFFDDESLEGTINTFSESINTYNSSLKRIKTDIVSTAATTDQISTKLDDIQTRLVV